MRGWRLKISALILVAFIIMPSLQVLPVMLEAHASSGKGSENLNDLAAELAQATWEPQENRLPLINVTSSSKVYDYLELNQLKSDGTYSLVWDLEPRMISGGKYTYMLSIMFDREASNIDSKLSNIGFKLFVIGIEPAGNDGYVVKLLKPSNARNLEISDLIAGLDLSTTYTYQLKDYNSYYTIIVTPDFRNFDLSSLTSNSGDSNIVYIPVININYLVKLTEGEVEILGEPGSTDLLDYYMEITDVSGLIDQLRSEISGLGVPSGLRREILDYLDSLTPLELVIKTKHNLLGAKIGWEFGWTRKVYNITNTTRELIDYEPWRTRNGSYTVNVERLRYSEVIDLYLRNLEDLVRQGEFDRYPNKLESIISQSDEPRAQPFLKPDDGRDGPGDPSPYYDPLERKSNNLYVTSNGGINTSLLVSTYPIRNITSQVTVHEPSPDGDYLAYWLVNGETRFGSLGRSFTYSRTSGEIEEVYEFSLKIWIDKVDVKKYIYYYALHKKNIMVTVTVDARVKEVQIPEATVSNIKIIPALAPIGGSGAVDYLSGTLSQLGFEEISGTVTEIQSAVFGNSFVNWVLPNYFPLPLMHSSLGRVAPGEYMGVYVEVGSIDFPADALGIVVNTIGGIGTVTLFYENVNVTLEPDPISNPDGVAEVVEVVGGNVRFVSDGRATMYSLGFGLGEIFTGEGKGIGPRIYVTPSSGNSIDINSDSVAALNGSLVVQMLREDATYSSGNTFLDLVAGLLRDLVPPPIRRAASQIANNGAYPQVTCYMGGSRYLWPYIIITPKTTYRFAALNPGKYFFKANYEFWLLHIRVLKVPFVGIPIPIPIPLKYVGEASEAINVNRLGVIPIMVSYEASPPDRPARTRHELKRQLESSYVDIYAVPVWLDESGKPVGPVLLRGRYIDTGLSVVAVTRDGVILGFVDVYSFGVPLATIRMRLSDLYRVAGNGDGQILLKPVWKKGRALSPMEGVSVPAVIDVVPLRTFVFLYNGTYALTYTGAYDPDNKLRDVVENMALSLEDAAHIINSTVIQPLDKALSYSDAALQDLFDLTGIITEQRARLEERFWNMSSTVPKLLNDVVTGVVDKLISEVLGRVAEYIVVVVLPDPTGVITKVLVELTGSLFSQDQSISGLDTLKGFLTEYGTLAVEVAALRVLENMMSGSGVAGLLEGMKDSMGQALLAVKTGEQVLEALVLTGRKAAMIARYKPLLLSNAYVVDYWSLSVREVAGVLGGVGLRAVMPVDLVETDTPGGGMLYVRPYSILTFVYETLIGKTGGAARNIAVDFPGALRYLAAWVHFLGDIAGGDTDTASKFYNSSDSIIGLADSIENTYNNISQYVEVPGLSAKNVLLPSYTVLPPVKIG